MLKKIFKDKNKIILFIILLIAFFFRIYKLGEIPPSLNWDEVSHGYNAYSILQTGRDEWGIKLPLIFRAYGDYKLPLYIYLTAVSELFFGLNSYSVRLVSVLSGVFLVLFSFLITKQITKNNSYSLLAAFLTAVTPWGLFLSRVAVEANLGACLFAAGIYFILLWDKKPMLKYLLFVSLFWGLALSAYNSARILVPLFVGASVLLLARKQIKDRVKQLVLFLLVLFLFVLPVIFQFLDHSGQARFGLVSLIDQGTINKIVELRNTTKFPQILSRAIYNRPVFFVYYAIKNYFSNLSFKYLFVDGGTHYQFSFPKHELLYLVTAPFLLVGLLKILLKGGKQEKILAFWFFLSIIPSSITKDAPHVLRTIFILPSPLIIVSLGVKFTTDFLQVNKSRLKGNLVLVVFILSVLVSFFKWWDQYLKLYPKAYSWSWQYGYSQVVEYLKKNYDKYDTIFVTKRYGEPHEFILFYFPYNPQKFQNDSNKKWDYHSDWYWVDSFDKFVFLNDWEVSKMAICPKNTRCLLVSSPGNFPQNWSKIESINFLDERVAFEIVENK